MTTAASTSAGRLPSLDGLRGVAALTVLFHHSLLIASPFLVGAGAAAQLWNTTMSSPFAIAAIVLTSGIEAVFVFFVLSGFVLTLPVVQQDRFDWLAYGPRRLIRIYLPVWASLVLAAALIILVPRYAENATPDSWLSSTNSTSTSVNQFFSNASLAQEGYGLNNPLWSLHWELLFSLLLPLYVWVARRIPLSVGVGIATLSTMLGAAIDHPWLTFLPVFLIGVSLAAHYRWVQSLSMRISMLSHGNWVWSGILALSLTGLTFDRIIAPSLPSSIITTASSSGFTVLGAAGMLFTSFGWPRMARFLSRNPIHWFGRISFSLYLVHVPILATITFAIGDANWPLALGIAIPASIVTAWIFYRLIEVPTVALARTVGKAVHSRRAAKATHNQDESSEAAPNRKFATQNS